MEGISDTILWNCFKQGDSNAFGTLVRQYYARLLNYGILMGFERSVVEDTIQDLFVSLFEKRDSLSDVQNVKAYFFISLRRSLLKISIKMEREKNWVEKLFSKPEVHNSYESECIDAEEITEKVCHAKKVINGLSQRQKEIIQLKFYEGLKNENIAEIMGITKQGVANLLNRTLNDARFVSHQLIQFLVLAILVFA